MQRFGRDIMNVVSSMTWSLERTRQLFVWLTLFALPWQTRWFQEGSLLSSFPWEQARVSIYASWILIGGSLGLRLVSLYRTDASTKVPHLSFSARHSWKKFVPFILSLLVLVGVCFNTTSIRATVQFCIEAGMLGLWVWSIWDLAIPWSRFVLGYIVSLLPSVLFGLWQYATQMIPRIKYLGVAAQDPLTRGVSVIEVAGERILRVYGTFPHPNIFAGWLVIAILAALFLVPQIAKTWQRLLLTMGIGLYTVTLVLTFSRAALIALAVCLFLCVCMPQ